MLDAKGNWWTSTSKDDHRAYYTSRARRLVERAFAPDLERFDYPFELPSDEGEKLSKGPSVR